MNLTEKNFLKAKLEEAMEAVKLGSVESHNFDSMKDGEHDTKTLVIVYYVKENKN